MASFNFNLSLEALITTALRPWPEIIRVARRHRCESLLIGLSDLNQEKISPHFEALISAVDCDILFLKTPQEWQLSKVKRILVPVGGKSNHDELRARLLGSLCRSMEREVTFLMVVSEETTKKELKWTQNRLRRLAEDEIPFNPKVEVVKSHNVVEVVREYAIESDLVILGVQRLGRRRKVFGDIASEIAHATPGATILISHRG